MLTSTTALLKIWLRGWIGASWLTNSEEHISNMSFALSKIQFCVNLTHYTFAQAISPTRNRELIGEAAEQFHKTWISCQTPCCYSCHCLACRDCFTRQGWWLTDCWCLGQGCACFPFGEIHMNIVSKGCLLDLYVVVSVMPLSANKHNIWTHTSGLQSGN